MENNNQDLLCCVRDMFGGCAGTPSSPNLRYMFAAVMQKDTDGCFSLKTRPVLESFDIVDCNNTISTVQSSGVVIEGVTAPIPVCIQGEKDFEQVYKCDLVTGNTILIRTVLNHDTNLFVTTYYDLVLGVDWVGNPADLTECTSNTLESDKVKLCDDNGEFYRWFVKDNGEPTGVSYDTDLSGAPYVPVGAVVECSDPTITLLPVCDVLTATVGGTIPYTLTTNDVAIAYTPSVVLTGDTALFYWTDFGDGYNDVGNAPSHTYTADGSYEIKSYVVTSSGNKILLAAKEIVITAGVVTIATANPQTVNRVYKVSVGSAMQEYSGTTPVGTPVNPDGSAYTVQGTLAWSCPVVIDELEDNGEWNPDALEPAEPEVPNGITYVNDTAVNAPQPGTVQSLTVTKQSGASVRVTFNGGVSFPLTLVANGSRTWGQGNENPLDVSTVAFQQTGNGTYDVIWETI